jgi:hypothetical protein
VGFTVRTLRRICEPLDVDLQVYGRWRGGELDRLLDAGHAALQVGFAQLLEAAGWLVRAEVTFSRYGERGSIDLLALHRGTGTLLVVEVKTVIADLQGLLRPLDMKVRLAHEVARTLRWNARVVVPCLVIAEDSTARRRVGSHAALFGRFDVRGWAAKRWLHNVEGSPSGVLLFLRPSDGTRGAVSRPGQQRIRSRSRSSRSATPSRDL